MSSVEGAASGGVDQEDLVKQFCEVTGVDVERARFYLEASGWQLQVAMGGFYEGTEMEEPPNASKSTPMDQQSTGVPKVIPQPVGGATQKRPQNSHLPSQTRGGLMTLDALRQQQESDEDSSDEDANKQAFYAGGSESSGQQVLGPGKKRDELIAEMFKKAREHGAEEIEAPQMLKKKGDTGTFSGAGYKLGETESEPNPPGSTPSSLADSAIGGGGVRDIVLRLWSQGFTVDGGQLRSYADPNNMAFLNSVKRGEVPRELIREFQGQEVSLTMEDRRTEDYAPPKPQVRPFAGKGQMLGSPAPNTVVSSVGPLSEAERKAAEGAARGAIRLTEGEATTNIQLRLLDGSRLVATFNPSHTVRDLHSFINTARPEYSAVAYVLTLFPNRELNEKSQSLKDAQVLNSALIQKIKQ